MKKIKGHFWLPSHPSNPSNPSTRPTRQPVPPVKLGAKRLAVRLALDPKGRGIADIRGKLYLVAYVSGLRVLIILGMSQKVTKVNVNFIEYHGYDNQSRLR